MNSEEGTIGAGQPEIFPADIFDLAQVTSIPYQGTEVPRIVKIPCKTTDAALDAMIQFWKDTEPTREDVRDGYSKLKGHVLDKNGLILTQQTVDTMRTQIIENRSPGTGFPYTLCIQGNNEPMTDQSLVWLKGHGILKEK
jgi:hypothetical protein